MSAPAAQDDADAMDVDATPTPKPARAPRRRRGRPQPPHVQTPRSATAPTTDAHVPFPTSAGPPSPTKSPTKQRSMPDHAFRRPSSPTKTRSSWFDASDTDLTSLGRSTSPTKSGSWASSRSSRSSSPSKSSRSSARPPSPTSLPWAEGRIPPSPSKTSLSSGPDSPQKVRNRPPSLRLHDNPDGIDPSTIVGKVLKRVHRGAAHPNLTLVFADDSVVQVKIEGYHPNARGLSKELEMDSSLDDFLASSAASTVDLLILDCALVRLTDKAFERSDSDASNDSRWSQDHLGLAFKFEGMPHRWYSVWATMQDFDDDGICRFRSYDDVFLSPVAQTPRRPRHARKNSKQIV
ncbi:hypothetical protein EXIGLDRAFT_725429 [Exidia glandulosa HHB12029]|uniref:Uncharacterized protein n=1 Tax=Exidia glandulosa HHB12029 TaxID=1314781 RepID=A0A165E1C3_EXIGL|nr:hypothetical protein EXIGLDRAFT_725429 [Exidia glandulosa HHB12029]